MEYQVFPNILCLLHCVPLYVCRLCINFLDLCARLLGMAALGILLLTFTPRSLLLIITPYGHVLYTKMLQIVSLVYPDPYKKGLGNTARSSVHIGMC